MDAFANRNQPRGCRDNFFPRVYLYFAKARLGFGREKNHPDFMKSYSLLAGATRVLAVAGLMALTHSAALAETKPKPFEGRLVMEVREQGMSDRLTAHVKGHRMRMEPSMQNLGEVVIDAKKKEILVLMTQERMYMKFPMPDAAGASAESAEEEGRIRATGDKRTILGHEAERHVLSEGDREFELWLTSELGPLSALHLPGDERRRASPTGRALQRTGLFPLLIRETGVPEGQAMRLEVIEVEKKELDDSLFEAPEGFTQLSMPGGMSLPGMPGAAP